MVGKPAVCASSTSRALRSSVLLSALLCPEVPPGAKTGAGAGASAVAGATAGMVAVMVTVDGVLVVVTILELLATVFVRLGGLRPLNSGSRSTLGLALPDLEGRCDKFSFGSR